jgi:hypothetical protein
MDVGSILVILAMFILVAGFLARPLLEKRGFSVTQSSRHLSELQTERDKILLILQELDMDHAMGKIPTEDYESQRPGLIARGAAILREIDELGGSVFAPASVKATSEEGQDLEAIMEKEILRRRKRSSVEPVAFCTKCGNRILAGDRFCTHCGTKVQVVEKKA